MNKGGKRFLQCQLLTGMPRSILFALYLVRILFFVLFFENRLLFQIYPKVKQEENIKGKTWGQVLVTEFLIKKAYVSFLQNNTAQNHGESIRRIIKPMF